MQSGRLLKVDGDGLLKSILTQSDSTNRKSILIRSYPFDCRSVNTTGRRIMLQSEIKLPPNLFIFSIIDIMSKIDPERCHSFECRPKTTNNVLIQGY